MPYRPEVLIAVYYMPSETSVQFAIVGADVPKYVQIQGTRLGV